MLKFEMFRNKYRPIGLLKAGMPEMQDLVLSYSPTFIDTSYTAKVIGNNTI